MNVVNSLKYSCMAAVLLACPAAFGQTQLGRSGQFAVSAERLTGLVGSSVEFDTEVGGDTVTITDSNTNFHFLIHPVGTSGGNEQAFGGYSFPRLAGDYFVIDRLSVGAALGYFSVATTREAEAGGSSMDIADVTLSGFMLAPRVGYALMFSDLLGIWPRAGISYVHSGFTDNDNDDELSVDMWALSLDVPLVIAPVPHVAFLVGPTLDYGFTGGYTDTDPAGMEEEGDLTVTEIGVQAGLSVYF